MANKAKWTEELMYGAYLKAHPEQAHHGRNGFHDDCPACMAAIRELWKLADSARTEQG